MRPGDVTAGRPVNLQRRRPGTLLVFFLFPPRPPLRNARIRQRRAGKVEVLTERQGHTQSRKPLESEWSSVFPIVERRRAAQEDGGGEVQRRAGGCRQQDGTVQREK